MKKFFLVLLISTIGIYFSCEQDSGSQNESDNRFFGSEIGNFSSYSKISDLKITTSKKQILSNAKLALNETGLIIEPEDLHTFIDNGKFFLRIMSKDNYITTVEIISVNGKAIIGETSCTSVACASGGGCVPDGLYCTKCNPTDPTLVGDCKRTTSNGTIEPNNP